MITQFYPKLLEGLHDLNEKKLASHLNRPYHGFRRHLDE